MQYEIIPHWIIRSFSRIRKEILENARLCKYTEDNHPTRYLQYLAWPNNNYCTAFHTIDTTHVSEASNFLKRFLSCPTTHCLTLSINDLIFPIGVLMQWNEKTVKGNPVTHHTLIRRGRDKHSSQISSSILWIQPTKNHSLGKTSPKRTTLNRL